MIFERCSQEDLFAGRRSGKYKGDGCRRTSAEDGPGAVFSNTVRRGWVDVSVVNPQAPSYVGKDAVVCRESQAFAVERGGEQGRH